MATITSPELATKAANSPVPKILAPLAALAPLAELPRRRGPAPRHVVTIFGGGSTVLWARRSGPEIGGQVPVALVPRREAADRFPKAEAQRIAARLRRVWGRRRVVVERVLVP